jgi:hypothetical protein
VALEEQVEAHLQHLFRGGTRVGVGERVPRRVELLEEPVRHRDVEAPQLGGERDGLVGARLPSSGVGRARFSRLNRIGRCKEIRWLRQTAAA